MKKCLIIINFNAGGARKISFDKVARRLGEGYSFTRFRLPVDGEFSLDGYDAVAVCGGDGTLSSVLEKAHDRSIEIFYFPIGTLNDKAKASRYSHASIKHKSIEENHAGKQIVLGSVKRESVFTYVLAAGSFTPIGYDVTVSSKKRFGVFAYLMDVLKQYKVHKIGAEISFGEEKMSGEFTLIMFLKSPRCFGFNFNRAFDAESASGHLVAIRSPKHGGFLGKVEMFFPFFRVFFLGLKKERDGKIIFKEVREADVTLRSSAPFCRDGEKLVLDAGTHKISFFKSVCSFSVIEKF